MEHLRARNRLKDKQSTSDVAALHYATTLFERNVWVLRHIALWMREDLKVQEA